MAWIESHQGLARHKKTKRLARKLGVSVPAAIGHLHLLWWWALDNLPDGKISDLEPEDIADEMMWEEDAQELIESLVEVGFIDRTDDGLYIHDWHDYIGKLLEKRKADSDRKRKSRESSAGHPSDKKRTSNGQGADDIRGGARNRTVPNSTLPNKINYADEVKMTEIEYQKLVDEHGEVFTRQCITTLDNFKGSNGKTYKSDYKAILTWVISRVRDDNKKGIKPNFKIVPQPDPIQITKEEREENERIRHKQQEQLQRTATI